MLSSGPWSGKAGGSSSRSLALAAACAGCDFQPDPAEGPSAVRRRALSSRQDRVPPAATAAQNTDAHAATTLVVFFGSWMQPAARATRATRCCSTPASARTSGPASCRTCPSTGRPTDVPHYVRVFDPHLADTSIGRRHRRAADRGRPDHHRVRLAGDAAGERPHLRRRQRRRPQPELTREPGRRPAPRCAARGCPGCGPRARAGARPAGRPGRPRSGARP